MKLRTFIGLAAAASVALSACNWKVKPTFPSETLADGLKALCVKDYKMTIEARYKDDMLQAFFWTPGLMQPGQGEMKADAAEALQRVLLCATRVVLSTDANVKFIEVKMADAVTGDTVKVWRYVPDIQDSMHTRVGEEEYFNRLVLEVEVGEMSQPESRAQIWDEPLSLPQFLAKQIILRAKRTSPVGLQAHEDLSQPQTLKVVIDNWASIESQGAQERAKVTDIVDQTAHSVLRSYRFQGFRDLVLEDNRGVSLGLLPL